MENSGTCDKPILSANRREIWNDETVQNPKCYEVAFLLRQVVFGRLFVRIALRGSLVGAGRASDFGRDVGAVASGRRNVGD